MPAQLAQNSLQTLLNDTRVGQLDLTRVPIVSREQSLGAATAAMREARHGSALVCEAGQLVGILTERDVLRAVGGNHPMILAVGSLMTANPKTLSPEESLFDAVQFMNQGGYRRLPVVDAEGQPLGLVDVRTVMNFLVEQISSTVYNQASRRKLTVQQSEGA